MFLLPNAGRILNGNVTCFDIIAFSNMFSDDANLVKIMIELAFSKYRLSN